MVFQLRDWNHSWLGASRTWRRQACRLVKAPIRADESTLKEKDGANLRVFGPSRFNSATPWETPNSDRATCSRSVWPTARQLLPHTISTAWPEVNTRCCLRNVWCLTNSRTFWSATCSKTHPHPDFETQNWQSEPQSDNFWKHETCSDSSLYAWETDNFRSKTHQEEHKFVLQLH